MNARHLALPLSTIDLLLGGPETRSSVAKASAWANELIDAGVTDDDIIALYSLGEDDWQACLQLLPTALGAVGAWRETQSGRMAVARDLLIHAFLTDRLSLQQYVAESLDVLSRAAGICHAAAIIDERNLLYEIEDVLDIATSPGRLDDASRATLLADGFDFDVPRRWVVRKLKAADVLTPQDDVVPANWGA